MRNMLLAAGSGLILSLILSLPAQSASRYQTPPATVLSGDLASPWLLQLKNNKQYQKVMQRNAIAINRMQEQQKKKQAKRVSLFRPAPQPAAKPVAVSKTNKPSMDAKFLPQRVSFQSNEKPGSLIIDTHQRFLYLVEGNGFAKRYGVGVGKAGFEWSGTEKITRKAEWPEWRPPAEMIARERKRGRELPIVMAGGPKNPLGARALYLGSTLYRIHGTNRPDTIGKAMSSGCIRMRNEDVADLYDHVGIGTKVIVR